MTDSRPGVARNKRKVGYDAFISYSHAADGMLAPALHNALQRFAKPWYRRRALHLFRDQTSLSATPGLWPAIETALNKSRYFLLLASPEAAQSEWVQREVAWWLEHKSPQTLLIALTEGRIAREPGANDFNWDETNALPPVLRGVFTENPLWVDFRWANDQRQLSTKNPEFQNALAALAAPLRGIAKEDLIGEDVRQHRRALLLARGAAALLTVLLIAAVAAAVLALAQRQEATQQARVAQARALAAQAEREGEAGDDELAALLAREAYLTSQRRDDSILGQIGAQFFADEGDSAVAGPVHAALQGALGIEYFQQRVADEEGRIESVAFSPDGTWLVAGGTFLEPAYTGVLRVWDMRRPGFPPVVLEGHEGAIRSVAFSPDGRHVAAGGMLLDPPNSGFVWMWDLSQPADDPVVLPNCGGNIRTVAFSPDGLYLAAGSSSRDAGGQAQVHLWDLPESDTSSCLAFSGPAYIESLAFSPDGRELAVGGDNGHVWLRDMTDPDAATVDFGDLESSVSAVAFSSDGEKLAAAVGGSIWLWDPREPETPLIVNEENPFGLHTLAFSPDGATLAAGGVNGQVNLRDLTDFSLPAELLSFAADVTSVAFRPDGQELAVAGSNRNPPTGRVWLADLGAPASGPFTLPGESPAVGPLAFGAEGRTLTAATEDAQVLQWDVGNLTAPPVSLTDLEPDEIPLAFSDDGSRLAVGKCHERGENFCSQGSVRVLDVTSTGAPPIMLSLLPGEAASGAFSSDGRTLAIGGISPEGITEGIVALWDLDQPERPPVVLTGHLGRVNSVDFSADGATLVSASWAGTVSMSFGEARLWGMTELQATPLALGGTAQIVNSVTFGPDGQTLGAAVNGRVRLWDVTEPATAPSDVGNAEGGSDSIAFSPDGRTLVAAGSVFEPSYEGRIWIWYPEGRARTPIVLRDDAQFFAAPAYSPDGSLLATIGQDGRIRLWIAQAGILAETVCATVWRNLTVEEWQHFIGTDAPYTSTCPQLPPGKDA